MNAFVFILPATIILLQKKQHVRWLPSCNTRHPALRRTLTPHFKLKIIIQMLDNKGQSNVQRGQIDL